MLFGLLSALAIQGAVAGNGLDRDDEPVILTGSSLPVLRGAAPARVVGFRFDAGTWTAVPVQVDQVTEVAYSQIYDDPAAGELRLSTYADAATFTGADPDPAFDTDDELVFLVGSAGDRAPQDSPDPGGVLTGTRTEIRLRHPVSNVEAYVYLFVSTGALDPAAGAPILEHRFVLLSGDYKSTYQRERGPNPENSVIRTPAYEAHFFDRWGRDGMRVFVGGASGVDILDRHTFSYAPGNCTRTEDTFNGGRGAFLFNLTGPIRALRGYIGANSGPTTHRIHHFYAQREEILTRLQVHAIPGILDPLDLSAAASGMTYRDDLNPGGVRVDGVPDGARNTGQLRWQLVEGSQGTIAESGRLVTDIPTLPWTSYYSDNASPDTRTCTGDGDEYGSHGAWVDGGIPNTDPNLGEAYRFEYTRVIAYGPPNAGIEFAERLSRSVSQPVVATVEAGGGEPCPDADGDGWRSASCNPDPSEGGGDCDDTMRSDHPGAAESCGDGRDNDCDGLTDAEDPSCVRECPDADSDGYEEEGCAGSGSQLGGDCSDSDPDVHPDAPEVCDGRDQDCTGIADDPECDRFDLDGNGRVDASELARLGRAFGTCGTDLGAWWTEVDFDGDGCVDGRDLAVLANLWARECAEGRVRCD